MRTPPTAVLLLAPTGAGKSPLGNALAAHGLWDRPCRHFDFGAQLRAAADGRGVGLPASDVAYLRHVLGGGHLLDPSHFHIATEILDRFLDGLPRGAAAVLNGLPRTEWQADAVAGEVTVRLVVVLDCPPDVAHARIARDVAGDRSGRGDDAPEAVASRLERFVEHAAPLADYYAARGAAVVRLDVGHTVTGEELRRRLERSAPGWPEGGPGQ